jgi:hypothetical protein
MRKAFTIFAAGASLLLAATLAAAPAHAAIQCEGPRQLVQGNYITTPYCEDTYLAQIAQQVYGIRVSAAAIRQNPNLKEQVCRRIGHDNRVKSNCQSILNYGDRFPW